MLNNGLATVHLIIVVAMILTGWLLIKNGNYSFLTVAVLLFAFLDSLGAGLVNIIHLNLPYLENTYIPIFEEPNYLYRLYFSHWIFFSVSFCFMLTHIRDKHKYNVKGIAIPTAWACILLIIGILLSVKFFVLGPGSDIVFSTKLKFDSSIEAIAHRSVAKRMMELGQGAYMASLAAKILFPASALIFLFNKKRTLFLISSILPLLYSLSTRQKGPIIISVFLVVAGLIYSNGLSKRKNIIVFLVIVFLSLFSYMYSFGLNLKEALISTLGRVFLVPSITEYNYYIVFPEIISFRGIGTLLKMPLGAWGETGVTIYDVAYAATRNVFSSNANFLAIAWSSASYAGIFVVSVLFCICLSLLDYISRKIPVDIFFILNLFMISGYFALISDSLGAFFSSGGFFLPLILVIINKKENPIENNRLKEGHEVVEG
jgi:hypothetical protein